MKSKKKKKMKSKKKKNEEQKKKNRKAKKKQKNEKQKKKKKMKSKKKQKKKNEEQKKKKNEKQKKKKSSPHFATFPFFHFQFSFFSSPFSNFSLSLFPGRSAEALGGTLPPCPPPVTPLHCLVVSWGVFIFVLAGVLFQSTFLRPSSVLGDQSFSIFVISLSLSLSLLNVLKIDVLFLLFVSSYLLICGELAFQSLSQGVGGLLGGLNF